MVTDAAQKGGYDLSLFTMSNTRFCAFSFHALGRVKGNDPLGGSLRIAQRRTGSGASAYFS